MLLPRRPVTAGAGADCRRHPPGTARGMSSSTLYKPMSWMTGALGGLVAGTVVKQVWKLVTHDEETPEATDRERGWREVLLAAALQGAVFGLVKAALDRLGASGVEELVGVRPVES